jgi:hypothetical protein
MHTYAQALEENNQENVQASTQAQHHQDNCSGPHHHRHVPNRYLVDFPSQLQGFRCYSYASISPDQPGVGARQAGISIFIVNTDMSPPFSFFIKASMQQASSVLMAESAGLALAASVLNRMHISDAHFLVDNQLLVNYINGSDHYNPPNWRIKPFTQVVDTLLAGTTTTVLKIKRT